MHRSWQFCGATTLTLLVLLACAPTLAPTPTPTSAPTATPTITLTPTLTSTPTRPPIQLQRVEVDERWSETLENERDEERTVSNCGASRTVEQTIGGLVSVEHTVELEKGVVSGNDVRGWGSALGLAGMESVVERKVLDRHSYATKVSEVHTESVRIEAPPGKLTTVKLRWKSVWRNGFVTVAADGQSERFPYRVKAALSIEVLGTAEKNCSEIAKGYVEQGEAFGKAGQYQQAVQAYTEALKYSPNDDSIFTRRGNAYRELKECKKASTDYTKALELNPLNVEARVGSVLTQQCR